MKPYKYTPEQEKNICKLYLDGKNATEVAKLFNASGYIIYKVLRRNGCELRNRSETHRTVKGNPFKDLTNSEVQYWLGFLAADGNLVISKNRYSISLCSAEKDSKHMVKYSNFIGFGKKPEQNLIKGYQTYRHTVQFGNKEVHEFLSNLGITPKKSKTLSLNIPLTWNIIRGIFDGDGCVYFNKIRLRVSIVTGSPKFLEQLYTFFKKEGIHVTKRFTNIGIIDCCTQTEINKFYEKMYKDANIYLSRKKEIFEKGPLIRKLMSSYAANSVKSKSSYEDTTIPSKDAIPNCIYV